MEMRIEGGDLYASICRIFPGVFIRPPRSCKKCTIVCKCFVFAVVDFLADMYYYCIVGSDTKHSNKYRILIQEFRLSLLTRDTNLRV